MSKKAMIKTQKTNKTFSYQVDDVSLNFTLNIDNSAELKKFRGICEQAIQDLTEQINLMKN